MKNISFKISIILMSILLGIILVIQYKTVRTTVGSSTMPRLEGEYLADQLQEMEKEKDNLNIKLNKIEKKIKKYEKSPLDKNINTLNNELQKYKMGGEYIDVKGPGIIIEINEKGMEYELDSSEHIGPNYDLFLQLISYLNAGGAEAISINDIRYTEFTSLYYENNQLKINEYVLSPPIIIKAIGNYNNMNHYIKLSDSPLSYMENIIKWDVKITKENEILIPKYKGVINFKYAKPPE